MTCSIHLATYNLCHSALKRFACAHHVLPHRQIDFQSRTRQGLLIWPGVCAACYRYLADCVIARQAPSNIFMSPGFELGYIALDSMHCGDLGVFQDAVGGLLWLEISNKGFHRSHAQGVTFLNEQLKDFYRAHPHLCAINLTVNMLKGQAGSYPTLKCKAAECRHLAAFAVVLAHWHARGMGVRPPFAFRNARLAPFSAEYRGLVVDMTTRLFAYHTCCEVEPFIAAQCQANMQGFLEALTSLRALMRRGLDGALQSAQPFPLRPKGHMLQHLVNEHISRWGSPRLFWCYGDEDFVGVIKRIALQTKHPKSMEAILLQKYRLFAALHALRLVAAHP